MISYVSSRKPTKRLEMKSDINNLRAAKEEKSKTKFIVKLRKLFKKKKKDNNSLYPLR